MASQAEWAVRHDGFLSELRAARPYEIAVAARLLDAGFSVRLAPRVEAATMADVAECGDDGDLVVEGRWVIEVKSSRYEFTGPHDWPFQHGAYLGNTKRMSRGDVHPIAYVLVSRVTLGMIAVSTASRDTWQVKRTTHPDRPPYDAVLAPRSVLHPFDVLVGALRSRVVNGGWSRVANGG